MTNEKRMKPLNTAVPTKANHGRVSQTLIVQWVGVTTQGVATLMNFEKQLCAICWISSCRIGMKTDCNQEINSI